MVAVQRNLSKFGIKEIARTGKVGIFRSYLDILIFRSSHDLMHVFMISEISLQIALRREKMGASAPFWRYSAASYPDLEETMPVDTFVGKIKTTLNGESDTSVRVCIYIDFYLLILS